MHCVWTQEAIVGLYQQSTSRFKYFCCDWAVEISLVVFVKVFGDLTDVNEMNVFADG